MGYTHYYELRNISLNGKPITVKQMVELKKILDEFKDTIGEVDRDYTLNTYSIFFNGLDDKGLETFHIDFTVDSKYFCKTNYKPYNLAVCATLIYLKSILKNNLIIHSNGLNEDEMDEHWSKAVKYMGLKGYLVRVKQGQIWDVLHRI